MAMQIIAVNYAAVIAATIVSFIIGMIWYGPLFGKSWAKMSGVDTKQKKGMAPKMVAMFITVLVMNYVLAAVLKMTGATMISEGLMGAFWLWLGFIATVMVGTVLWEGKPVKLYMIKVLHYLVVLLVASVIIVGM